MYMGLLFNVLSVICWPLRSGNVKLGARLPTRDPVDGSISMRGSMTTVRLPVGDSLLSSNAHPVSMVSDKIVVYKFFMFCSFVLLWIRAKYVPRVIMHITRLFWIILADFL